MADQYIHSMTDTWNSSGTIYYSVKMNVTNTASHASSKLMELQIGGAAKFSVAKTSDVTITSDDAGASAGPVMTLYRNSASPAASDIMGKLLFQGEDSASNAEDYSEIYSTLVDPTSTSEDASLLFRTKIAGTMTTRWTLSSTGAVFTGRIDGPDGSVGAPPYTFTSDTDTGLYRIGADNPAFSAGGTKVWEATASLFTVALAAQFDNTVTLASTDAGAAAGPTLNLYRNSASPAASDIIGNVVFQGEDSAGNTEDYSQVYSRITDPTSTSEDADLLLRTKVGGTMRSIVELGSTGAVLNDPSDPTKQLGFGLSGITTGTKRTLTMPDTDVTITSFAASILDDANEAAFKATVNLEIGTDVQAWDADLDAIAALAKTDGNFIVGNGTAWVAESGATARTSLGLGTAATQNTGTSGTNVPLLDGANTWSASQTFSGVTLAADGAVGAPGIAFSGDTDTGWYRIGADNPALSVGGAKALEATTAAVIPALPVRGADGSVSAPAYSFSGDTDTGIYRSTSDTIDFTVGGVRTGYLANSIFTLRGTGSGAGAGPIMELYRDSVSPAASDQIGSFRFSGEDSLGNQDTYADMLIILDDVTSGSEDASFHFRTVVAGTIFTHLQLSASTATFYTPPKLPSYTVAGVPSASTAGAGTMIYVSNETGGATPAFSDGTNWRRVADRAVIS